MSCSVVLGIDQGASMAPWLRLMMSGQVLERSEIYQDQAQCLRDGEQSIYVGKVSMNEVDWWSRIPAYAGLAISVFAVLRGRTYLKVSLGNQRDHEEIFVSNMSPHEVEVISLGAINADGSLSDWTDGPQPWRNLPKRIPARGHATITLDADIAPANLCHAYNLGQGGCFVRVTGGRVFSNPGLIKRKLWQVRSLFRPKVSNPLE